MPKASRRRQHGEGGLYKRSDGMWVGAIDVGWTTDGKRKRRTVSSKSLSRAQAKLDELKKTIATHGDAPDARTTVEEWLNYWLEQIHRPSVRPLTYTSTRVIVDRHLVPNLGKRRLDQLAPQHVRELHRTLERAGLAPSYVLKVHRTLAKALTDALRDGKVTRNVATLVNAPRQGPVERPSLTADQAKALLRFMAEDPMGSRWAAALLLGARRGEVIGLQWDRVDFQAGTVELAWQLQRIPYRHGCGLPAGTGRARTWPCGNGSAGTCPDRALDVRPEFEYQRLDGGLCLTRPKTAAGKRLVPLVAPMAAFLQLHRREQPDGQHDLVWTRDDGRPIDPRDDSAAWVAALVAAGLPAVVLHSARHTAATSLLATGADVKVVQQILGQSSMIAARGYQHVSVELARAALTKASGLSVDPLK